MSANIYQGEITLIKIDDGVNAPVITKIYDFYYLSNSAEPPQVLGEDRTVEEIKNSGWFEKTDEGKNTNINNDTPYLWNFKRTEYSDGKVEHGPAIIASFWATAPQVLARYSADGMAPWDPEYDSKRHNYIIFSYDDGQTWGPFTNGATDLENGIGGIRIKGRVEVDEAAVSYNVETSQNEVLRYINQDRVNENFSPNIINIWATKEYLNIIENIKFIDSKTLGDYEKDENGQPILPENSFVPALSCTLKAGDTSITELVNDTIFNLKEYSGMNLLIYDYSTNIIKFDFESFYNYVKQATKSGALQDHNLTPIFTLFSSNEVELILKLTLTGNGKTFEPEKRISIRFASTQDLARFSVEASAIVQSIRNSSLTFNVNGLTVKNGGFRILQSVYNYVDRALLSQESFLNGRFYKKINKDDVDQYVLAEASDWENAEILLYTLEEKSVLEANQSGGISIVGNGSFSGTVYADAGEFKGRIQAESGFLEDLDVYGALTISGAKPAASNEVASIKLSGQYHRTKDADMVPEKVYYYYDDQAQIMKEFGGTSFEDGRVLYEKNERVGIYTSDYKEGNGNEVGTGFLLDPSTSTIYANQIKIGELAEISNYLSFTSSNDTAYIYNPEKHEKLFIEAKENGISTLKIYANGLMEAGNGIIIDGPQNSIHSKNFIPGAHGWRINSTDAEFNNITARGTLRSVVMEYDKVSTVGGSLLVRPSAMITGAELSESGEAILTLDIEVISFNNNIAEDNPSPYFFRIGNIRKGYVLVSESAEEIGKKKQVTIKRYKHNFTKDQLDGFIGQILIGYGKVGDIGIGINSQESSAAMPPEAISIFETNFKTEENGEPILDENDDYILEESCRLILGQLDKNRVESMWGTVDDDIKYGLVADQVFVKGALVSTDDNLYSGIDSYSKAYSTKFLKKIGEQEEKTRILLWAGAPGPDKINEAPFQVDELGNLLAMKGHFEGTIAASEITTSILKTATVMGREDDDKAALTITNADKAIEFINILGEDERKVLELNREKMILDVPLVFNEVNSNAAFTEIKNANFSQIYSNKIYSPNIEVGQKLSFYDTTISLKVVQNGVLFDITATGSGKDSTIVSMLEDKTEFYTDAHLKETVYFGEETLEYRKIIEETQEGNSTVRKIVGYDLYIKS